MKIVALILTSAALVAVTATAVAANLLFGYLFELADSASSTEPVAETRSDSAYEVVYSQVEPEHLAEEI